MRPFGVDVFSGYGVIDWGAAAVAGVQFAYIKCTEGNEPIRNDRAFARNAANARGAGIYVGAYHFPYPLPPDASKPGRSPREQAERAFAASQGLGTQPGELPHVVDAEWPEVGSWGKWGCTGPQISAWLREYCEHATELWGRKPLIYTYPFWWRALAASADVSWAKEYGLWIANYTHSGPGTPPETSRPQIPPPWDDWLFWQYSAEGSGVRVPGIPACPLDRDVFRGDINGLRKLALIDPDADTVPEIRIVDQPIVHPPVPLEHPSLDEDDEPPPQAA